MSEGLLEIRERINRIGCDWDYDMTDLGRVIDIGNILRELLDYLIEREALTESNPAVGPSPSGTPSTASTAGSTSIAANKQPAKDQYERGDIERPEFQ